MKKKNDGLDAIRKFACKVNKPLKQNNSRYIISYIRVSDEKQADNFSPAVQKADIKKYVKQNGLKILKEFKILGESARRGAKRQSMDDMFDYIKKSEHKIHSIVVSHSNRFTRDGAFGDKSVNKLIELGIGFIDARLKYDIFNPDEKRRQIQEFYDAEQDNINRSHSINRTIIHRMEKGYCPNAVPRGYKRIGKKKREKKIVMSGEKHFIKKMFELKLKYNYSNVKIAEILRLDGMEKIDSKGIGRMLRNPFYSGYFRDKRLIEDGGIKKGRYPNYITTEQYEQINNLANGRKRTIRRNDSNDLPLRKHLICSKCNKPMTGYKASKRNELFYYKCGTKGCGVNVRNTEIHHSYKELLSKYCFDPRYNPEVNNHLITTFNELNKKSKKRKKSLKKRIKSITGERITALRNMNKYPKDREDYRLLKDELQNEIDDLAGQLSKIRTSKIDIENQSEKLLGFMNRLSQIWLEGDFSIRFKLQHLVFPDGIVFDKLSNTLKPIKINPIIQFLDDFDNSDNLGEKSRNQKKSRLKKVKYRTTGEEVEIKPFDIKRLDYKGENKKKNLNKIPEVHLQYHRSNISGNDFIDSLTEIIDFIEFMKVFD